MAQRAAVRFWSSSPEARSKNCPRVTSFRMPSGATWEGPTRRSTGARWRDATLSTRWSSSWLHSLHVHRYGLPSACPKKMGLFFFHPLSYFLTMWTLEYKYLSSGFIYSVNGCVRLSRFLRYLVLIMLHNAFLHSHDNASVIFWRSLWKWLSVAIMR